jgi:hypothetical protein
MSFSLRHTRIMGIELKSGFENYKYPGTVVATADLASLVAKVGNSSFYVGEGFVFDAALKRELHELMQEAKEIAGQIKQPSDLWDLQEYLNPTT